LTNAREEKSRVVDWEGGAIESASIAAFVGRKTMFLPAKIMPDKRSGTLNKAAVRVFRGIPAETRNTLTLDNGREFTAQAACRRLLHRHFIRGSGGLN
jgi:IS30 family transposase